MVSSSTRMSGAKGAKRLSVPSRSPCASHATSHREQSLTHLGEELFQGSGSRLIQALVDGLSGQQTVRKGPQRSQAQQAPHRFLTVQASQEADQKGGPQTARRELAGPTSPTSKGGLLLLQARDHGAQKAFHLIGGGRAGRGLHGRQRCCMLHERKSFRWRCIPRIFLFFSAFSQPSQLVGLYAAR